MTEIIVGKIFMLDRDNGHFGIRDDFGVTFGFLDPHKQDDIQLAADSLCGEVNKVRIVISSGRPMASIFMSV